ncbi:hypothetical protein GYA44_02795 [Candidatus Microgenomates bacterium]|nr:hypothetical protein [Candidatus Microgenomates bacterium]
MAEPKGRSSQEGDDGWSHETFWEGDRRVSYEIKPDKSGGFSIAGAHVTNQNVPKGQEGRHEPDL